MERQIFSEEQAAEIMKSAVKLQERFADEKYVPGVTESELKRMGQEVGLAPEIIERAILEYLAEVKAPVQNHKLKFSIEEEHVIEGEIDPNDYDILADIFGQISGKGGAAMIGRSLQGNIMTGMYSHTVLITSRNGRTRIKIKSIPLLNSIFGFQAMLMGSLLGTGIIAEEKNLVAGSIILTAGLLGGGTLVLSGLRGVRKAHDKLMTKIESRIRDHLSEMTTSDGPLPEQG